MKATGHFHVQPRLVEVVGGMYRSREEALKELVANCRDADASRVDIRLPLALDAHPIVVSDDGRGMTRAELELQYLSESA